MSPTEFADCMSSLADNRDRELAHVHMDALMCQLLISLGYSDGVRIWEQQDKWFA